ncbi:hypothetical protein PAMP_012502 [Pampus punctatissimus]
MAPRKELSVERGGWGCLFMARPGSAVEDQGFMLLHGCLGPISRERRQRVCSCRTVVVGAVLDLTKSYTFMLSSLLAEAEEPVAAVLFDDGFCSNVNRILSTTTRN